MKNSKVVQCKRCQRLSHTATQCQFQYRCVQCINQHQPGQCPRIQNSRLPLGCINCASNKLNHRGHTANDIRKCEYFKTLNKNKEKSKNTEKAPSSQAIAVASPSTSVTAEAKQQTQNKKKNKQMIAKYRPNVISAHREPNTAVNGKSNSSASRNSNRNTSNSNNDISQLITLIRGLNKALTDFANGLG